jgi:hypothetical protein
MTEHRVSPTSGKAGQAAQWQQGERWQLWWLGCLELLQPEVEGSGASKSASGFTAQHSTAQHSQRVRAAVRSKCIDQKELYRIVAKKGMRWGIDHASNILRACSFTVCGAACQAVATSLAQRQAIRQAGGAGRGASAIVSAGVSALYSTSIFMH